MVSFPANNGDQAQCFANGRWYSFSYRGGRWMGPNQRYSPLYLQPGASFFVTKATSTNWVESF